MPIQILKWIILCKYSNSENSLISQTEVSRKKTDILDRWINRWKGIKPFLSQEARLPVLTVYVCVCVGGYKCNHICLYVYMMHALIYACMCMPVWLYMCIVVCKCLCDYMDIWYVCVFMCTIWLCVFMLGCMFVHIHVFVCVFLHL